MEKNLEWYMVIDGKRTTVAAPSQEEAFEKAKKENPDSKVELPTPRPYMHARFKEGE